MLLHHYFLLLNWMLLCIIMFSIISVVCLIIAQYYKPIIMYSYYFIIELCYTIITSSLHQYYISIMSLLQLKKSCKNETGYLNCSVWFSFTLGLHNWPDSDKCLKWAMLIWNNGWPSRSSAAAFPSFRTPSERSALACLLKSTSPKFRRLDNEFWVEELGLPHCYIL